LRILLIEDDKMIGEGVVSGLKSAGMSIDWVRDGVQAEAALREGGYAIALLDLGLPGADGLEVLASLGSILARTIIS
jgi:two-component system OmpR family response regulator